MDYDVAATLGLKVCSDHFNDQEITTKNHIKKLILGAVPSLIPLEFPESHEYEKFNQHSYSELLRKVDESFLEKKKQVIANEIPDRIFVVDPQTIDISAYPNDAEDDFDLELSSDEDDDGETVTQEEFSTEDEDDEFYEQTEKYEPNLNLSLRKSFNVVSFLSGGYQIITLKSSLKLKFD